MESIAAAMRSPRQAAFAAGRQMQWRKPIDAETHRISMRFRLATRGLARQDERMPCVVLERGKRVQDQEPSNEPRGAPPSWVTSVAMLRAVLDGATYDAVAASYDVTRTAVERRIKWVAVHLANNVGIDGLNSEGATFVRRLRLHRAALQAALPELEPPLPPAVRDVAILTQEEIAAGALRIRGRSHQPSEDLALYYMLFAIGARPLEIARLEVRDYIDAAGAVRRASVMREEVAITSRARPMYFQSSRLDGAMADYLAERLRNGAGLGVAGQYRGLDPQSRLFLSSSGKGFEITPYGREGQRRFRCRGIQETYRKLFRYAEFKAVTALTARHTVADRLYARGADESQVGLLLGIADRSAVRDQFPRRQPSIDELTNDLV